MSSGPPLSRVGLRLPRSAIRVLRNHGIYGQSSVSLEHQHLAKRYVIRGVESGGAAGDVGHYVTFAHENGEPLDCFWPVETVDVNGPHAIALAPVLVRIEMTAEIVHVRVAEYATSIEHSEQRHAPADRVEDPVSRSAWPFGYPRLRTRQGARRYSPTLLLFSIRRENRNPKTLSVGGSYCYGCRYMPRVRTQSLHDHAPER